MDKPFEFGYKLLRILYILTGWSSIQRNWDPINKKNSYFLSENVHNTFFNNLLISRASGFNEYLFKKKFLF